jgi:hypothetical protein
MAGTSAITGFFVDGDIILNQGYTLGEAAS